MGTGRCLSRLALKADGGKILSRREQLTADADGAQGADNQPKTTAVITIGPIGNDVEEVMKEMAADDAVTVGHDAVVQHYDLRFLKPLDEKILRYVGETGFGGRHRRRWYKRSVEWGRQCSNGSTTMDTNRTLSASDCPINLSNKDPWRSCASSVVSTMRI